MREDARTKGQRLVAEGRLKILYATDDFVKALCRGDSGEDYALGYADEHGGWYCLCQARGRCSHLVALQLVTGPRRVKEAA